MPLCGDQHGDAMNEDKSARYNRLKRQWSMMSTAWSACLLAVLALTAGARVLRDVAERVAHVVAPAGWERSAAIAVCITLLVVLNELGSLPIGFYGGYLLDTRYGVSKQTLASWCSDQAKSFLLGLVLTIAAGRLLYAFIDAVPDTWWLPAGIAFALVVIGLANLAPLILMPLFYSVKPLTRESLRARLVTLAERAGAHVLDAYEWGLGQKTTKANAALTGIGRSRRILVSDTMLEQYTEDEIEVVLAHELAHHVHGDIWKGIAFEAVLILAGFFAAAHLLVALAPVIGFNGPADLAGLPVLVLAAGAVSLIALPAAHAMSRAHERSADRFALHLTQNPGAFVSAMKRLGAQNLAEDEPSQLVQWLFYSHPPIRERIAAAREFRVRA